MASDCLLIDNPTQRFVNLSETALLRLQIVYLSIMVCLLLCGISLEIEIITPDNKPILRRKSMELLKELTETLWEIVYSDDEASLRRLEATIRALVNARHRSSRTLH